MKSNAIPKGLRVPRTREDVHRRPVGAWPLGLVSSNMSLVFFVWPPRSPLGRSHRDRPIMPLLKLAFGPRHRWRWRVHSTSPLASTPLPVCTPEMVPPLGDDDAPRAKGLSQRSGGGSGWRDEQEPPSQPGRTASRPHAPREQGRLVA